MVHPPVLPRVLLRAVKPLHDVGHILFGLTPLAALDRGLLIDRLCVRPSRRSLARKTIPGTAPVPVIMSSSQSSIL
jgi:hypothetical protein